jgi:hypothetical protein
MTILPKHIGYRLNDCRNSIGAQPHKAVQGLIDAYESNDEEDTDEDETNKDGSNENPCTRTPILRCDS